MTWPSFDDVIPEAFRGGRGDVLPASYQRKHEDAWRRYVAKRVQGAEDRAIALVMFPAFVGPFAVLFDGRNLEVAAADKGWGPPAGAGIDLRELGLPQAGLFLSHGGVTLWRESLTPDRSAHLWRDLGGDEAFALPTDVVPSLMIDGFEAYALVRRGSDRVRVELGSGFRLPEPLAAWFGRFRPYLRADVRDALLRGRR